MLAEQVVSGRIVPQNLEAEQAVLGAMLMDFNAVLTALDYLRENDFYKFAHSIVFSCIIELYERNEPIDLVTINNLLLSKNLLDKAGGTEYITELSEAVPTSANIAYHAKIIREKAIIRNIINSLTEIITNCYEAQDDVDNILDSAESKIFDISAGRETSSVVHVKDEINSTFATLEKMYKEQGGLTGVPSGFKDLDAITSGFNNSELVIIAARPSMGKTAFACAIIENITLKENKHALFFSVEMSKESLVQRLLCSYARISSNELRKGFLAEKGWQKLTEAANKLSKANIYIDDTPGITILDMKNKARRLKAQGKLDLIAIDYLQLMNNTKNLENRQQEISNISRSLKALARELKVPLLALSQLSRAVESRADHKPMLSDLRESGAIEQDADLVLMLMREEYYNATEENRNKAQVIVCKNRNGPTGSVELTFLKEFTRFENAY
jgi:replicative DNA helicase